MTKIQYALAVTATAISAPVCQEQNVTKGIKRNAIDSQHDFVKIIDRRINLKLAKWPSIYMYKKYW
jgi:hypothetical protein